MSEYYVAGGTLHPESPCYVERDADRDLYENLLKGEFCYVLTSRQMGKSSLMARTAWKLKKRGFEVVMVDLTAVGQNVSHEQWYDGLIMQIGEQLDLEDEIEDFWEEQSRLSSIQRFVRTLTHVVLEAIPRNLIIFIDEIDVVQSLPFSADELFGAIRECYNRRTREPKFQRLDFCLLGVASPVDLVSDASISPFNSGVAIELRDFDLQETEDLAQGLNDEKAQLWNVSHQIFHWTQGHPYLTLRLYRAMAELPAINGVEDVDGQCREIFLQSKSVHTDPNLIFVHNWLLQSDVPTIHHELMDYLAKLAKGQKVPFEDENPIQSQILFSGFGILHGHHIVVRNQIYQKVFDSTWVQRHKKRHVAEPNHQVPSIDPKNNPSRLLWGMAMILGVVTVIGFLQFLEKWSLGKTRVDNETDPTNSQIGGKSDVARLTVSDAEGFSSSDPATRNKVIELGGSIFRFGGSIIISGSIYAAADQLAQAKIPDAPEIEILINERIPFPSSAEFHAIPNAHLIRSLEFNGSHISDESLAQFPAWENVSACHFYLTAISDKGLPFLNKFPKLDFLHLSFFSDRTMRILAVNVPQLRDLSFSSPHRSDPSLSGKTLVLSDESFAGAKGLPLETLRFVRCRFDQLSDSVLEELESVRILHFLDYMDRRIPFDVFAKIGGIRSMELTRVRLSRADIISIAGMKNLDSLTIYDELRVDFSDLLILKNSSIKRLELGTSNQIPSSIVSGLQESSFSELIVKPWMSGQ